MELGKLTVQIQRDGDTVDVDVDLDPNHLTLQESVLLEKHLDVDKARALFAGEAVEITPQVIQVIIWTKLTKRFPDIELDGFDLEIGAMADMMTDDDKPVVELAQAEIETALFVTDVALDSPEVVGKVSGSG